VRPTFATLQQQTRYIGRKHWTLPEQQSFHRRSSTPATARFKSTVMSPATAEVAMVVPAQEPVQGELPPGAASKQETALEHFKSNSLVCVTHAVCLGIDSCWRGQPAKHKDGFAVTCSWQVMQQNSLPGDYLGQVIVSFCAEHNMCMHMHKGGSRTTKGEGDLPAGQAKHTLRIYTHNRRQIVVLLGRKWPGWDF
jgi:hypothetical protein